MGVEIERKWKPSAVPASVFTQGQPMEYLQGYLCREPVVRVRREGESYWLTYKGKGYLQREEYNLPLTVEAFAHLLPKCDGQLIKKTRWRIPLCGVPGVAPASATESPSKCNLKNNINCENYAKYFQNTKKYSVFCSLVAELDQFHGSLEGLCLVEVEFPDLQTAHTFQPPSWFGAEVTKNPCFSNAWLSCHTLSEISNGKTNRPEKL